MAGYAQIPNQNAIELAEVGGENRGEHRMPPELEWDDHDTVSHGMHGFFRRQTSEPTLSIPCHQQRPLVPPPFFERGRL